MEFTRSSFVRTGIGAATGLVVARPDSSRVAVPSTSEPLVDGTGDPFPIPWLDRNGSHNQVPAPGQEPAHLFHFQGNLARCNDFRGMGTDGHGKRLRFGGPTTDIGLMRGRYIATDGKERTGTFLHL